MKRYLKKLTALALALALAASLGGCGPLALSEEERTELRQDEVQVIVGQSIGQELAATYAADHIFSLNSVTGTSYNPYLTSSAWNKVVAMLVYETLVEEDETFAAHPNLITSWETEDGRSWVFHVDTDRSFHDGGRMTAADAVYSINMARSYDSPYATRFRYVTDVAVIDEASFAVALSRENYRFYELLNIPCVEYDTGYNDLPPGTGPYAFSGSGRYLIRVKDHPKASQMPLETIHLKEYTAAVDILQAFEDSYIDMVINDPTGMSSLGYSSTNIIKYVNTSSMHYLGYNMDSRIFGQSVYRSFITYAIDRATIVSEVMKGAAAAATMPVAPQSELYPASLAQAVGYSDSALDLAIESVGARDLDGDGLLDLGGAPYTIDFVVCSDSGTKVAAARNIAKKLQDKGFDVNLRELGYDEYVEALEKGNFDIYYAEVRLCGDWDLSLLLYSGADLNYGGVRDNTLDELLLSFLAAGEEGLLARSLELYQYIGQNAYITPICFEKSEVLYHRGVLSGLNPTQDSIFYGMENWTINLT